MPNTDTITVQLDNGDVQSISVNGSMSVNDLLAKVQGVNPGRLSLTVSANGSARSLDPNRDGNERVQAGSTVYTAPKNVGGAR